MRCRVSFGATFIDNRQSMSAVGLRKMYLLHAVAFAGCGIAAYNGEAKRIRCRMKLNRWNRALQPLTLSIITTVVMSLAAACSNVNAQSETLSHRQLDLPNSGLSELPQQMQMLKLLQSYLQQKPDNAAVDSSQKPPDAGLKPEQLNALRDVMKNLGINGDSVPDLSMIPPEAISQAMSDPKTRQQMQDLLQEFRRTGQMPSGSGNSSNGVLPPTGNASESSRPTGTSSESSAEKSSQQDSDNQVAIDDIQRRFNELQERIRGKRNSPNNSANSSDNNSPNNQPNQAPKNGQASSRGNSASGNTAAPPPLPGNPEDWKDFLEDLIKQQRESGETQPLRPDEFPNGQFPNAQSSADQTSSNPSSPSPTDGRLSAPQNSNSENTTSGIEQSTAAAGSTAATATSSAKSDSADPAAGIAPSVVADFLKNQQELASSNSPGVGSAATASPSDDAEQQALALEEIRKKQEQAQADLQQSGLQATLKKIAREARKQVAADSSAEQTASGDAAGDNSAAGNSGSGGGLSKMLGGLTKDILEIAQGAKPESSNQPGTGPRNLNSPDGRIGSAAGPSGSNPSWMKSAGKWVSDLATDANTSALDTTGSSLPAAGGSSSGPGLLGAGWVFVLFGLLSLGIFLTLLAKRHGLLAGETSAGLSNSILSPSEIRSKRDVVKAFHQLALHPANEIETWWTHQKVEDQISEASPGKRLPMSKLASLYEEARYLPEDVDFDEDKLIAARTALELCRS